jgi:hypothetical protein
MPELPEKIVCTSDRTAGAADVMTPAESTGMETPFVVIAGRLTGPTVISPKADTADIPRSKAILSL